MVVAMGKYVRFERKFVLDKKRGRGYVRLNPSDLERFQEETGEPLEKGDTLIFYVKKK